jgi:proline dehydrogenase
MLTPEREAEIREICQRNALVSSTCTMTQEVLSALDEERKRAKLTINLAEELLRVAESALWDDAEYQTTHGENYIAEDRRKVAGRIQRFRIDLRTQRTKTLLAHQPQ